MLHLITKLQIKGEMKWSESDYLNIQEQQVIEQ